MSSLGCARFEPLDHHTIHVWFAFTEEVLERSPLSSHQELLSGEELARSERFIFEHHRRDYVVACALKRAILSRCVGVDPTELRFRLGEYGKPALAPSHLAPDLQFSVTHTQGLSAVAVSSVGAVGVDAEMVKRSIGVETLKHLLAPIEFAALWSLPESDRYRTFFELWTLKEAYLKARGLGLTLPLDSFAFQLRLNSARIQFTPPEGDVAPWSFFLFSPRATYCMAVAAMCTDGKPRVLHRHQTDLGFAGMPGKDGR